MWISEIHAALLLVTRVLWRSNSTCLPADTASVFKLTGADFLGQVFSIMESEVAGVLLCTQ